MKKYIGIFLSMVMAVCCLAGCSNNLGEDEQFSPNSTDIKYAEGDIYYEESPNFIYSGDPNLANKLTDGMYYVCHNEYFYPLYTDWTNIQSLKLGQLQKEKEVFDRISIVKILLF